MKRGVKSRFVLIMATVLLSDRALASMPPMPLPMVAGVSPDASARRRTSP